jgi:4-hydroxythreonine-4-phosphate dehydrogenase
VVTGPVSKAELAGIGYAFPGQTEFFAARWGGEPVMAFCGGKLRVVLATWHVPLCEVARTARPASAAAHGRGGGHARAGRGRGATAHRRVRAQSARRRGRAARRRGARFHEPGARKPAADFPGLSLCEPGDTLFARSLRGEFDVVVALYHDQGLAPLKVIDFDEAVNVTLGLPHVRTSPDHGTAFGIAGKGVARATSFANAVTVARRLIAARTKV